MSKAGKELECASDNIIYNKICPLIAPRLVEIGITPNMITTTTLIIRLIILYLLYKNYFVKHKFLIFILLWNITNITDALDGYIARKYNMGSEFGGKYDSFVDTTTIVILILILIIKSINNNNYLIKGIIFILILIDFINIYINLVKIIYIKINKLNNLEYYSQLFNYKNPIKNKNNLKNYCPPNVYNIMFILYYILFILL